MAAVKLSAVVFLASSADVSASLSCCSCTLRNCFCRLTRASSRSFFASLAARYFRMATLKEITATVSAIAAVMILPWSPRKASRNVQSIELMALIAAPRYCQTPDNTFYASCSLSLLVFFFYAWTFILGRLLLGRLFLRHSFLAFMPAASEAAVCSQGQISYWRLFQQVIIDGQVAPFCPCLQPKKPAAAAMGHSLSPPTQNRSQN